MKLGIEMNVVSDEERLEDDVKDIGVTEGEI